LGNVTLDDCSIKANEVATVAAPVIVPEPLPAPVVAHEATLEPVAQPAELKSTAPPIAVAAVAATPKAVPNKTHAVTVARELEPVPAPPVEAAATDVAVPDEHSLVEEAKALIKTPEQDSKATEIVTSSSTRPCLCNATYAVGGFLLGAVFLFCVKLVTTVSRSKANVEEPSSTETRRVALEALLSRQKK
jgi:hypothetical protein